eukprot:443839_1
MAVSLSVGDVVYIKPSQTIGLVKYIGPMVDTDVMSDYVGIELLESVSNGHNGTIDGFTYFTARRGYGFHTKIANVLKKVFASELFEQMQLLSNMLQKQSKQISKLELCLKNIKTTAVETSCFSVAHSTHSCVSRQSIPSRQSVPYSAMSISSMRPSAPASDSYEISYNIDAKPSTIQSTNKTNERRHSDSASQSTSSFKDSSEKKHKKHHKSKNKSKERRKGKMRRKSVHVRQKSRSQSLSNMYDSLPSFQPQPCTALKLNRANTAVHQYTISNPLPQANQMVVPSHSASFSVPVVYPSGSSSVSPFMNTQQFNGLSPYYLAPPQSRTQIYPGDCNHAPYSPAPAYLPYNYHHGQPNDTRFMSYPFQPQRYGRLVSTDGGAHVTQSNEYYRNSNFNNMLTSQVTMPINQYGIVSLH